MPKTTSEIVLQKKAEKMAALCDELLHKNSENKDDDAVLFGDNTPQGPTREP